MFQKANELKNKAVIIKEGNSFLLIIQQLTVFNDISLGMLKAIYSIIVMILRQMLRMFYVKHFRGKFGFVNSINTYFIRGEGGYHKVF